jgi:carbamoyltransferase
MSLKTEPWVLGISASHNGAVCLLKGDRIVAAIQEERLTRIKRHKIYGAQHSLALDYCLEAGGISAKDLSAVVVTVQGRASSPLHDVDLNAGLQTKINGTPVYKVSHHYAHGISALAASGFSEAAVLVVDGIGSPYEDLSEDECNAAMPDTKDGWEMISMYAGQGTELKAIEKHMIDGLDWISEDGDCMAKFRSLGTIFSATADQIFGNGLDAGKVMGLAPYGRPTIPIDEFFDIVDGRFVFYDKVRERFKHRDRWPLRGREYEDLACSAQTALEHAILYLARHLHDVYPSDRLCYAGGVALNSVANERIVRETPFKEVYIIAAAEDSGAAIGAAYYGLWKLTGENSRRKLVHDAVGREYQPSSVDEAISETVGVEVVRSADLVSETVDLLTNGKIVGWFQGRSELGPRALGQRSILCDPRRPDAKLILNSRVKHREAFRPFAPAVLLEEAGNWFEAYGRDIESPFMLRVWKFKEDKKDRVPGVVHVDGTGRVQTVTKEANGLFYDLIKKFHEKTGVPIILNTSFNVMGMPIVETPEDALVCMMSTGIDYCLIGNMLVKKRANILLGNDVIGRQPASQMQAAAETMASGFTASKASSPNGLERYLGTYRHATGTVTVEQTNQQLTATYNGMSTRLEPVCENTFRTAGALFDNTTLTFRAPLQGHFDVLAVKLKRDFGPIMGEAGDDLGEAVFSRVPEPVVATAGLVERITGDYWVEGKTIRVVAVDGQLAVTGPDQVCYKLVPESGHRFNVKNTPGYSLEFLPGKWNGAVEAVITQPNGVFLAKKR